MHRRDFLKTAAALPLATALWPRRAHARTGKGRILVLLELNGGNDGINTVVPYGDPRYRQIRPSLALPRDKVLQLRDGLGLAPDLAPLMQAWQDGDLGIALGVGYPRPNRSHFRSIEIWNTASDSEATLQEGWLSRALREAGHSGETSDDGGAAFALDGIVLGGSAGPFSGAGFKSVVMRNPERFLAQAGSGTGDVAASTNPALAHILRVRGEIFQAAGQIEKSLVGAPKLASDFPRDPLGRQLALAARLIAAGLPLKAIKLAQSGYDTHANQRNRHGRLLGQLAAGLAAFRQALQDAGKWDQVLVMTYAEFGRRAGENASGGTDHGTAAPHFLLGGKVKGGFYGRQPSLGDLAGGDLKHSLDFRRLYATATQNWWGLPPTRNTLGNAKPLDVVA